MNKKILLFLAFLGFGCGFFQISNQAWAEDMPEQSFNPGVIDTSFVGNAPISELGGAWLPNFTPTGMLTLEDNSKLVVGNYVVDPSTGQKNGIIVKITRDGKFDTSFGGWNGFLPGTTGWTTLPAQGFVAFSKIAISVDGRIVVVGSAMDNASGAQVPAVFQFILKETSSNSPGDFDPTFNTGNPVLFNIPNNIPNAKDGKFQALVLDKNGGIYAGGYIEFPGSGMLAGMIVHFNVAGSLDGKFNNGSKVLLNNNAVNNLLIHQGDGWAQPKIIFSTMSNKNGDYSRICASTLSGTVDNTFGGNNNACTGNPGVGNDYTINSLTLDHQGRLLAAGMYINGDHHGFVARYNGMGVLDTKFGKQGMTDFLVGTSSNAAKVAVDIHDNVLVAGFGTDAQNNLTAVLGRFTPEGQMDTRFGGYNAGPGGVSFKIFPEMTKLELIDIESGNDNIVAAGFTNNGKGLSNGFLIRFLGGNDPILIPGKKNDAPLPAEKTIDEGSGSGELRGGCSLMVLHSSSGTFSLIYLAAFLAPLGWVRRRK